MNYKLHYQRLIDRAPRLEWKGVRKSAKQWSSRDGIYREGHRIVPGCFGGKYIATNVVYLTPEEHYVAHQLLVKMYPDNRGLIFACWQMNQSPSDNGMRINNRVYGWLKRAHSKAASERSKGNKHNIGRIPWNKGMSGIQTMPESMKEATRKRMLGNSSTKGMKFPNKKITQSFEQRQAASERLRKLTKGVKWTPERIAKRTASRLRNKVAA